MQPRRRPPPRLSVTLHRMREGEDLLVFTEAFEATALACRWPEEEWATQLLPLLSGKAQTAVLSLPPRSRGVFEDVCQAVLDRLGVSPEDYRCQFRASRMMGGARQLEDAAARWLRSGWGGSAAQSGRPRAIRGGLIGSAATARQI